MAKKKIKSWNNVTPTKGEVNTEKSITMPDMENDPRTVLENHVRGINPITGAILDKQRYFGDAIMPYQKDLTYEELRVKRESLEARVNELNTKMEQYAEVQTIDGDKTTDGSQGNETVGTDKSV
jgi:hypothetical protein